MNPSVLSVVVLGSVLLAIPTTVVVGQRLRQCTRQEKCVPIRECAQLKGYADQPSRTWPDTVKTEARNLYCGKEGKIHKFCCSAAPEPSSSGQPKKGRDLLDLKECGKQTSERIAHGKVADVFDYPWMALLRGIEEKFHCGGTLIAERYVLTAAHCNFIRVWYVRLGETDLSQKIDCKVYEDGDKECADPPQDIPVEKFIRHRYSSSQKKNDIALVRLQRPAQLNDNVHPICLPLPEVSRSKLPRIMTVTGWGYTEIEKAISDQLRFAHIPILDPARCNSTLKRLKTAWSVDQTQICAGAGKDKADNCHGDSGGPLQYYGQHGFVIYGVVSYGVASCGTENEPGVYTKVSHYLDWILENLI